MSPEQQKEILEHTFKQLTNFCGKPPVGSVAPWWEVSKEGTEMILDKGILYGKSASHEREIIADDQTIHSSIMIVKLIGYVWGIAGNL